MDQKLLSSFDEFFVSGSLGFMFPGFEKRGDILSTKGKFCLNENQYVTIRVAMYSDGEIRVFEDHAYMRGRDFDLYCIRTFIDFLAIIERNIKLYTYQDDGSLNPELVQLIIEAEEKIAREDAELNEAALLDMEAEERYAREEAARLDMEAEERLAHEEAEYNEANERIRSIMEAEERRLAREEAEQSYDNTNYGEYGRYGGCIVYLCDDDYKG